MADEELQTGEIPDDAGQGAGGGAGTAEETPPDAGTGDSAPRYTDADVQRIVRGRLAAEQQKHRLAQAVLDGLVAVTGRRPEEILTDLQQLATGAAPMAQPGGDEGGALPPEVTQAQYLARQAGLVALQTHRQLELAELQQAPTLYAGLDDPEAVNELVGFANQRGLTLKEAYWLLHGERRAQEIQKEVEQRVLERVRTRSGLGAEGDSAVDFEKLGLTAEEAAFAKAQGMSPQEYAALKGAADLDSFRALKKRAAKGG